MIHPLTIILYIFIFGSFIRTNLFSRIFHSSLFKRIILNNFEKESSSNNKHIESHRNETMDKLVIGILEIYFNY